MRCFDRDDGTQEIMCPKLENGWFLQDMHTDSGTHTHTQSHAYTLAEVGDMEDAMPVYGVSGGDGQGIAIGDKEEIWGNRCSFEHLGIQWGWR
jgi:hypothetical protein